MSTTNPLSAVAPNTVATSAVSRVDLEAANRDIPQQRTYTLGCVQKVITKAAEIISCLASFSIVIILAIKIQKYSFYYMYWDDDHYVNVKTIQMESLNAFFLSFWIFGEALGLMALLFFSCYALKYNKTNQVRAKIASLVQYYFVAFGSSGFYFTFVAGTSRKLYKPYYSLMIFNLTLLILLFPCCIALRYLQPHLLPFIKESEPYREPCVFLYNFILACVGCSSFLVTYCVYTALFVIWSPIALFGSCFVLPFKDTWFGKACVSFGKLISDIVFIGYEANVTGAIGGAFGTMLVLLGMPVVSLILLNNYGGQSFTEVCNNIGGQSVATIFIIAKTVQVSVSVLLPILKLFALAKLYQLGNLIVQYPRLCILSILLDGMKAVLASPPAAIKSEDLEKLTDKVAVMKSEVDDCKAKVEHDMDSIASILLDYQF